MKKIHQEHKSTTPQLYNKKLNNWSAYNQSLVKRGNISIYLDEAIAQRAFAPPSHRHHVGHPQVYADALIELIVTLKIVCRQPFRQSIGLTAGMLRLTNVKWDLPDYSTVSRRMSKLEIDLLERYRYLREERNLVLLLDSSGFKVFGEGEWKVRKHGLGYRRTWRETHLSVDYETRDVIALTNTNSQTHDSTQVSPLLTQSSRNLERSGNNHRELSAVIGDGAYDNRGFYDLVKTLGAKPLTPPSKNAIWHGKLKAGRLVDDVGWTLRNQVVGQVYKQGLNEWKQASGYHRRSIVENTFYRLKVIFGERLSTRNEQSQNVEQRLKAKLLNRYNTLGLPRYEILGLPKYERLNFTKCEAVVS